MFGSKANWPFLLMIGVLLGIGGCADDADRRGAARSDQEVSNASIQEMLAYPHRSDRILVKHTPGMKTRALGKIAESGARVLTSYRTIPWHVVEVPSGASVSSMISALARNPSIERAHPDYEVKAIQSTLDLADPAVQKQIALQSQPKAQILPNDPRFGDLWGMHNTGQLGGVVDADIDAPEAWDLTTGSPSVIVADIDSGVDYTHPDLAANIWVNAGEIPGNGIDDDGNGYIDDIHGYDWVNLDGDPMDDNNHGTHTTGTIAAVGNNGVGVAGVAWQTQIMALKFLNAQGSGPISDAILAIEYSIMMGATISNNSWGCTNCGFNGDALWTAIQAFGLSGGLFIAAAGNGFNDNDGVIKHYPSSYDLDNIIAVAASDRFDQKASFSNWGLTTVDLAAPGVAIWSTTRGNTYSSFNGTSMSTPHVVGVAVLVKAQNPSLTELEIKAAIMNGVRPVAAFSGITVTGGVLNAFNALGEASPPPGVRDILVDNGHGNFDAIPLGQAALANWQALQELQGHIVDYRGNFSNLGNYRTLVLFLPNAAYTAAEVQAIDDFLQGGGRVVLVGEYGAFMEFNGIDAVLNAVGLPYGVQFANTVVKDPSSHDGIPEWIVSSSLDDFSDYTAGVLAMVEYAASSLDLSLGAIPLISGSANAIVSVLTLSEEAASRPLDPDRTPAGSVRSEAIVPGAPVLMAYNTVGVKGGEVLAIGDISLFLDSDPDGDGIGSLSEYSNAVLHTNLTNLGPPRLVPDPASLAFSLAPGEVASQILTLSNVGGADLILSAIVTDTCAGCLSIAPISGTIPSLASQDITVTVDAVGLAGGIYSGEITLTSNDPNSPLVVPVSMEVFGPDIDVTPTSIEATLPLNGSTTVPMTISNLGNQDLSWSIAVTVAAQSAEDRAGSQTLGSDLDQTDTGAAPSQSSGLSVFPTSGTTVPGGSDPVTVSIDAAGLAVGVYTGNLAISSNDPDEPVVNVPVTLTVEAQPPQPPGPTGALGGETEAVVVWEDTLNTPADVDGYRVHYSNTPGVTLLDPFVEVPGFVTSTTIPWPTDTTYFLRVSAFNALSESALSAAELEVRPNLNSDLARPPAVSGLTAVNLGGGSVQLSWTPSLDPHEDGFVAQIGTATGVYPFAITTLSNTVTFTGLPLGGPSIAYFYRVSPYRSALGRQYLGYPTAEQSVP